MGRMPSLVPIAPELEREARAGQMLPQPPDDGLGEAGKALAKDFGKIAEKVGLLADHAATVEGHDEGHLAGMDPEFRTRKDGTIRGEAFDKAGLATAKSRISVEVHNEIEQAALKHRGDPQTLLKVIQSKAGGWEGQVPQELVPEVRSMFARGGMAAFRDATRQLWAQQAEAQKAAMQEELARSLRSTQQLAYAGGLDDAAVQSAADSVVALDKTLSQRGPDGKLLVAPAARVKLIADTKEIVARAQLEGAFDRQPSQEARAEMLRQLEDDFSKSRGVAAAFDYPTFQQVRGHLESKLRQGDAAQRQANGVLVNAVKEVERRATSGEPVRQEELAALQSRVVATNDPNLQAALDDGVDSLRFMGSFKTLPLPAMEQAVDQMRQEMAAAPSSLLDKGRIGRRLKHAEEMLSKAQSEVKRNPLAWEGRTGMATVTPLGAVNLAEAGTLEAWGHERRAQAEEAARRHGLGRPQYLEPVEQRALAKRFEQGGEQGLQAVTLVRRAFGDAAPEVMRELGKDAPAGTLLADLAIKTGTTPAVLDGAEGLHIKAQPGHKHVAPDATKSKLYADEVVGAALGQNPGYLDRAMKLADAIYERRAHLYGKIEAFDDRMWKQALREALGETEVGGRKYGGIVDVSVGWSSRKVVLPPNVDQKKASSIFLAITPDDLGAAEGGGPRYGNGRSLTRQELRSASYVTVEPGKYWLLLKGDGGPGSQWAGDGNGRPFVLDLEQAMRTPTFQKRRPDLAR